MVENAGNKDADDDMKEAEKDDDNDKPAESDTEAAKVAMDYLVEELEHENIWGIF